MTLAILCIEDEPDLAEDLALELADAGHAVSLAATGEAALAALELGGFDVVLCDVQIPGLSGLDLLARETGAGSPGRPRFLMLTAYSDPALHARCMALGAAGVMVKPVDYGDLLRTLETLA